MKYFVMLTIMLLSITIPAYAQNVSDTTDQSAPPEAPQIEKADPDVQSEDFVSIQAYLSEFYGIDSSSMWYVIIIAIVSLAVTWKLTQLKFVGICGIFIITVSAYFLFPPLCQNTAEIFKTHCGTDEKFFGAIPFSASSLGFGILLLIYSLKSKSLESSERIRK